jgi:hypothetical protein
LYFKFCLQNRPLVRYVRSVYICRIFCFFFHNFQLIILSLYHEKPPKKRRFFGILFKPHRLHGIFPRRLPCGIDAEDEADEGARS